MTSSKSDICQNSELIGKLKEMMNNKRYSDTVFLVNKIKYHASSHLVGVSSVELESILETHYENCGDREIKIGNVKYDESFPIILSFMYGQSIDLNELSKPVLCEVLSLADQFEIKYLVSQLKTFLSKLEVFEIDFVIPLLNASKKLQIVHLYEKLKIFTFGNAEEVVKHDSFAELHFDVLLELVKDNYLFADEIDILQGVLHWHDNNMSKNPNITLELDEADDNKVNKLLSDEETKIYETPVIEIESDEKNYDNVDKQFDNVKTGIKETPNPVMELDNGSSKQVNDNEESVKISNKNKSHATINNDFQSKSPMVTEEMVKEFSTNVLKTLLSHIRYKRLLALDMYNLLEEVSCPQYKVFLSNPKYFSLSTEPRVKYSSSFPITRIKNVTLKFIVNCPEPNVVVESNEEHGIGDINVKLCAKYTKLETPFYVVSVFLKCSLKPTLVDGDLANKNWKCKTKCQVKIILTGTTDYKPSQYLPGSKTFLPVVFSPDRLQVELGDFYYSSDIVHTGLKWTYDINNDYSFQVEFIETEIVPRLK